LRSLAIRERELGADHPDVATVVNNLGELFRMQKNYAEAEPLFLSGAVDLESVVWREPSGRRGVSFKFWPALLGTWKDPGGALIALRAVEIWESSLGGPNHPTLIEGLTNLATMHPITGVGATAETLYTRALAITERELSSNHPNAGWILSLYAALLRKMDRNTEAERARNRAQAIMEKHVRDNRSFHTIDVTDPLLSRRRIR
jgi:Tetratricopeptide repeat